MTHDGYNARTPDGAEDSVGVLLGLGEGPPALGGKKSTAVDAHQTTALCRPSEVAKAALLDDVTTELQGVGIDVHRTTMHRGIPIPRLQRHVC